MLEKEGSCDGGCLVLCYCARDHRSLKRRMLVRVRDLGVCEGWKKWWLKSPPHSLSLLYMSGRRDSWQEHCQLSHTTTLFRSRVYEILSRGSPTQLFGCVKPANETNFIRTKFHSLSQIPFKFFTPAYCNVCIMQNQQLCIIQLILRLHVQRITRVVFLQHSLLTPMYVRVFTRGTQSVRVVYTVLRRFNGNRESIIYIRIGIHKVHQWC